MPNETSRLAAIAELKRKLRQAEARARSLRFQLRAARAKEDGGEILLVPAELWRKVLENGSKRA